MFDSRSCLNSTHPDVKKWIDNVGKENMYKVFVQNNYLLPDYESYIGAEEVFSKDIQDYKNFLDKLLPSNQYEFDVLDRLKSNGFNILGTAAFYKKTFYFKDKVTKNELAEEAFHSIVQTLMDEQERTQMYNGGRELLNQRLKKEKRSFKEYISELEKLFPNVSRETLEQYAYEEEIAKDFVNYYNSEGKTNRYSQERINLLSKRLSFLGNNAVPIAQLLHRLYERIKSLFNLTSDQKEVEMLFKKIANGGYKNTKIVNNNDNIIPSFAIYKNRKDRIIPSDEIAQMKRSIAVLAKNLYETEGLTLNTEQSINQAIQNYKSFLKNQVKKVDTDKKDLLKNLIFLLNQEDEELLQEIADQVEANKTIFDEVYDEEEENKDDDLGSNRNFDDSANQQSPESRSKELKILMNTTGTIKGKVFVDTTGKTVAYQDLESLIITDSNGNVFSGDLSVYKKIDILEIADEKMIYSAIVRNLSNISDEKKRLLKLIELSMYNEDVQTIKGKQDNQNTKTFINALLKDILGTSDDFENLKETTKNNLNSTESLSDIININSKPLHVQRFLLALRGFNLASRNIYRVEIDLEKGWGKVADIEASNKKSIQKNYWDSNYRTNQDLSYDKFKKEFSDNYIKFSKEIVNEEKTNVELARIYNKILEQLGVDVNGEYLIDFINKITAKEYPILYNNRVFTLDSLNNKLGYLQEQIEKRTEYPNLYKGDDKDTEIGAEKDPLDDIDFNSFLNFIAEGNIEFDERVIEASHKDGYGNSVYSHQLPTLTLKFGNSFKSIDEFNKMKQGSIIGVGVDGEVITSNAINSFKDENPLIDDLTVDGEISALRLKQVKILTFDTTQLKSYKSKTSKGFLIENDSEYSDNKVIGLDEMNDSEYALTNMILYTEHAKQTEQKINGEIKLFYNAPVSLGHNEASKQTDYLTIFHDKDAIAIDGQLGEQAKQKIAKLIKTEYDKIKENANNLKDQIAKLGKPTNKDGIITRNELYNIKEPNVYEGYSTGSYTAVLDESGNTLYYKASKGFKGLQFSPEVSPFVNEELLTQALLGNEFNETAIKFKTVLDFLEAEYKIIENYGLLDKLPHALRDNYLVYNPKTKKTDLPVYTEGKNTNGVELFNKELSQENKVKSFLLNYWLGSTMSNRMRYGSHNFNFKLTSTDSYKRYRMFNGATLSAKTSIKNEQLGINNEISYITYATIAEPKGISDIDRNSKPIDRADAAMRSTSQGIRKILHGMSKLNRKISEVLDKIDQGVKLTPKEWEEMVATSSLITAMKPLAASGEQTIKTGLTPTLTLSTTSYDTIITADKNKKFKNEKDTFNFGNNKITVDKYGRTTQSVGNTEEIIWDNFNKVFKLWKAKPGDKDLILYSQRMFLRGFRKEDGVWTYKGSQYEIDTLVPPTALKTAQRNILPYVNRSINRTDGKDAYVIEDTDFDFPKEYNKTYTFANAIDADFFGEQVQNPQGKVKITTPTQNIEILTNEQNNTVIIRIIENGVLTEKIIELKDLQPYYQKLLAKRNSNGKNLAVAELFKKEPIDRDIIKAIYEKNGDNLTNDEIILLTEVGNDFANRFGIYSTSDKNFKKKFDEVYKENGFRKEVPNYTYFFEKLIQGLKLTGGSGQDYEFLETNDDGTPIYNVNIPLNKDKMIQYVLKHFSSGVLSHKVAGNAYVLASDYGMKSLKKLRAIKKDEKIIDYTWDVIHNKTEGYNEKLVKLAEKGLEDLSDKIYDHRAWQIGDKKASELHSWFEEQKEKLERGEEVYFIDGLRYMKKSYTESGEFNTWVSEAMLPKLNGKQTSIMDSIRFALGVRIPSQDKQSSINIEWVDFLDDTIGNTIVVPKEIVQISGSDFDIDKLYATQYEGYWENGEYIKYKDTFEDYKKYLFKTSKPLKKALKDRLAENNIYQDSKTRKKDLKEQKKALFDKININAKNTLEETGLDKKEFKLELNRFFEQLDEINNSEESEKDKRDYKQYLFLQYKDLLSTNKDISQSFKEIGGIEEELDLVNKIIEEETSKEEPFVLKQFDLISSKEDFKEGFNNAVLNNNILDTQRAMLTSDSVLFGDINNPARGTGDVPMDLSLLENLQKNSTVKYSKNTTLYYEGNITPEQNTIFVFGSNPEGIHGAGAALNAKNKFGAIEGIGFGLQGNSFALPTKDLKKSKNLKLYSPAQIKKFAEEKLIPYYKNNPFSDVINNNPFERSISPKEIVESIKLLYSEALNNPTKQFKVAFTEDLFGYTLNGYLHGELIEMFNSAGEIPKNIIFSKKWIDTGKLNITKQSIKSLEEIKKIYGENIKFKEDDNQYIVYPFITKEKDKDDVELLQVFKSSLIPHNSLTVQSNYQQGTIIARRGIGVTVNGLLQAIVANKIGLQLRLDKFNLSYNGDPVEFTYKDHNGNRVFAIKNTLVSAATDEAKEEQLKRHGIKGDDLNVIDLLTNFGFSIDESIAIVNSKIVKTYKDFVNKNNLALKEDKNEVKSEKDLEFEELIQELKGDENGGVNLTPQKIFESLYTENVEILGAYLKIAEMSRELSDLAKLIKGKKGYTKGKLSELTDIQNIATKLGLIETMKEYKPSGYFDWTALKYSDKVEDIKSFVRITQELTNSKLNKMFFEYESIAINLKNTVLGETNKPDNLDLSDMIEKDVNTFMIIQMIKNQEDEKYKYLQDFLNIDKINPSNNTDNFVNEFFEKKQISKEGNAYKLLKHIIGVKGKVNSTKNSESVDTLRLAAVSKLNPAQQDNIRNLFLEMYHSDNEDLKIREDEKTFAKNLFAYFVLKDGLQFRQYNISKIFPTEMFLEISEVLNDFKNTLGYLNNKEIEILNSKFKELWYSDIKNKKYKQKIKPGKAVISYKFENKEKVEQKEFKFGDPPLYLEIPINARIKDLKKSNIEYESSLDGVVIKLPQYFDYNGYSFKRIKTDDESVYTYIRQPYYGSTIIDMVVDAGVIPAASEVIGKNGSKLQNLINQLEQEGTRTGYIQFYKNLLSNRYSPNFDKTLGVNSMNQRVQKTNQAQPASNETISTQSVQSGEVGDISRENDKKFTYNDLNNFIKTLPIKNFVTTHGKYSMDKIKNQLDKNKHQNILNTSLEFKNIFNQSENFYVLKKYTWTLENTYGSTDLHTRMYLVNTIEKKIYVLNTLESDPGRIYSKIVDYAVPEYSIFEIGLREALAYNEGEVNNQIETTELINKVFKSIKLPEGKVNQSKEINNNKNIFITKVDQYNYTLNTTTGEVIHNTTKGDKPLSATSSGDLTQIGKVYKNYAIDNNFETKLFNGNNYSKVFDRIVNVANGNIVNQKEIRDLFTDKTPDENLNLNKQINAFTNKYELFPNVYANGDQEKALDLMFDFVSPENKQKEFLLIGKGGTGKAQPLYSKIYTPDGYKLMRDIKVGDEVLNEQGKSTTVLGVYPQGIKPVYRVYFNDGFYVDSCSEHNWFVKSLKTRKREIQLKIKNRKLENKYEVVTTSEILNSIKVYGKNKSELNYKMPINDSVFFNKKDLNIHPYLLGALIGDGGLTESIRFTNIDSYILKKISAIIKNTNPELDLKQVSNTISYGITKKIRNSKIENKIWEEIKKLGLNTKSENKFIPKDYLYTSKEDRIELLQGLMDTDGTVDKRGTHVMYNTCSKKLADDVAELVQSLGCIARITHKLNNKKGCYNITINQTNNFNLFSLPRKQEKVINKTKYKVSRYISDVKYIGDFEQQCIMVSSPSHLYLTDNFTVTHNTTIVKKVVENLIKQGISRKRIFGVAPTHVAKKVLNKSFNGLIAKDNVVTLASALGIKLDETTGEFEKDYNLKGITSESDYIILDESSMVSDSLFNLLKSMVKSGTKIIFMGDKGQLPPVGQETDSKVFDINNTFELLEKMRQAATSPIINITEAVYKAQKEGNKNSNPITDDLRVDKFDDVSGSSVSFLQNEKEFLQNYVNDLKLENDFFNTKIVTFNNERNNSAQSVKTLNNKVRNILFGSESQKVQFFPDEIITSYGKWGEEVNNGDNFVIKKINEFKNQSHTISVFSKAKGQREINIVFDEIDLLTINDEGDTIKITVLANSSKEKYDKLVSDLWKKDKQLAFAVSNYYANIQYGYAITSHKSQGSTYKNVYVAEDNILGGSNLGSTKSKLQSLYVATSRASKKLVMLSNKNNREKITNFEEEYFIEDENMRYEAGETERDVTSINDLFAEASGCNNF